MTPRHHWRLRLLSAATILVLSLAPSTCKTHTTLPAEPSITFVSTCDRDASAHEALFRSMVVQP